MKNKLSLKKIVVICCISVVLALITAISFNVYVYSSKQVEYKIEFTENTKIKTIGINTNNYYLSKLKDNDMILDEDGILSSTYAGKEMVIKAARTDNFYVAYLDDGSQSPSDMIIYRDGELQKVKDSEYTYLNGKFSILKNSLNMSVVPITLITFFVMFALVYYLNNYYTKIKNNDIKLYNIILALVSMFIIFLCTYYLLLLLLRKFIVVPIICILIYNLVIIIKMDNRKIENIYATFVIIAGIAMLFMMAPFNVPDEASHFLRAYKDSLLVGNTADGGFWKFPESVYSLTTRFNRNLHNQGNKLYAENYISEVFKIEDYDVLTKNATNYGNVKNQTFLPYLPSAIVLFIGRNINMPVFILFLLCRLVNLIISVSICYIAIKIIPYFKKPMLVVCLFPIFIQQSAAINMDYLTNATIIMLVAYIVYLIYEVSKITTKELLILVGICCLLVLGKFGYFPILALMFLIPNDKFKNKKVAMACKILFITLVFLISFGVNMKPASSDNIDVPQETNVYGIKYIFENPFRMAKIVISTIINRVDQDILRGFIDCYGYSTIWNRGIMSLMAILMYFVFIMIKDDEDCKLELIPRLVYILTSVCIIGIVYVIAFLLFTTRGANDIFGIQARYFVAPSILLYIGLANDKFNIEIKNKKIFYSTIITIMYSITFITIGCFFS